MSGDRPDETPSVYGVICQHSEAEGCWLCFDDCTTVYGVGGTQGMAVIDYIDSLTCDAAWLGTVPLAGPLAEEYPRIVAQAKRCGVMRDEAERQERDG